MKILLIVVLISYLFFHFGCSSVAYTGRKQLNLVPNSQLISTASSQYKQVLTEGAVIKNSPQATIVKRVGERIKVAVEAYMAANNRSADLAGYNWEFNLLKDDKMVNAWCMPGGKVAFYTGIMPICQDEQGVAVVMGHEIAHAIANHGRERFSQSMIAQYGLSALSGNLEGKSYGILLQQAVGMGTNLGMLKFSRDHESEADHLGIIFMAMAGYDPDEAPKFWGRMAKVGGAQQMEFLSTHPSHETRIADLNNWLPEARKFKK